MEPGRPAAGQSPGRAWQHTAAGPETCDQGT